MTNSGTGRATTASPSGSSRGRPLWRVVRIVLVLYLLALLATMMFENSLIFFPSRYPEGNWNMPGLAYEDAHFEAPDGTRLHGWYVEHEKPRAVILLAHGNGGNLSHRYELLQNLHDRCGVSVMIFDYRGYGRSAGTPSVAGVLSDARAARAWLAARAKIPESDIVLMGESLGGGVAVDLAAGEGARALILENTFSSLPDVGAYHYPWLPVKLLMRSRLDSQSRIGRYHGPLLQLHGDADTIVPIELGRRVFAAANEPKRFVVIPGADHNDPRSDVLYDEINAFLTKYAKESANRTVPTEND